eukprot:scpid48960/ scgid32611/ Metabotropic glutamate receptor 2
MGYQTLMVCSLSVALCCSCFLGACVTAQPAAQGRDDSGGTTLQREQTEAIVNSTQTTHSPDPLANTQAWVRPGKKSIDTTSEQDITSPTRATTRRPIAGGELRSGDSNAIVKEIPPGFMGPCEPDGCVHGEPIAHMKLAGVLDITSWNKQLRRCSRDSGRVKPSWQEAEAIRYTVERDVNNSPHLLPGFVLGFDLRDVCRNEHDTLSAALSFIWAGRTDCAADRELTDVAGVHAIADVPPAMVLLGPSENDLTASLAKLASQFGMPLLSYTATDPQLSDKCHYGLLTRTITSDQPLVAGMLKLIEVQQWMQVVVLHERNSYGQTLLRVVRKETGNRFACTMRVQALPMVRPMENYADAIRPWMESLLSHPAADATVFVLLARHRSVHRFLTALPAIPRIQHMRSSVMFVTRQAAFPSRRLRDQSSNDTLKDWANRFMLIGAKYYVEPGFERHLLNLYCSRIPEDILQRHKMSEMGITCPEPLVPVNTTNPWLPSARALARELEELRENGGGLQTSLTRIAASRAREAVLVVAHAINNTVTQACTAGARRAAQ